MRVSLEGRRLRFFWLEAETNLCARGSGLCGAAGGGQAVPFPPLGVLGPSSTSPAPAGGFRSFPLLLAPPGRHPERAAAGVVAIRRLASWQLGGCRHGDEEVASAAAQLLICMSAYVGQLSCRSAFLPGAASAYPSPASSFPRPGGRYPAHTWHDACLRWPESVGPAWRGGSAARGGSETCSCLAGF